MRTSKTWIAILCIGLVLMGVGYAMYRARQEAIAEEVAGVKEQIKVEIDLLQGVEAEIQQLSDDELERAFLEQAKPRIDYFQPLYDQFVAAGDDVSKLRAIILPLALRAEHYAIEQLEEFIAQTEANTEVDAAAKEEALLSARLELDSWRQREQLKTTQIEELTLEQIRNEAIVPMGKQLRRDKRVVAKFEALDKAAVRDWVLGIYHRQINKLEAYLAAIEKDPEAAKKYLHGEPLK